MSQETVKAALQKAIGNIQQNPARSRLIFRAQTHWEADVRCSAKVRNFMPMIVDEPPDLGGGDAGPNPVELVLVALGTCQEVMYSAYASVMGIALDEVRVDLKGQLDLKGLFGLEPGVPPGYQKVSYETTITSAADADAIRRLVATVESCCPVLDTLTRAIEVRGKVTVNGTTLELAA